MLIANHKKLRKAFDGAEEEMLSNAGSAKEIKRILRDLYHTTMSAIITDEKELEEKLAKENK